MKVYLLFMGGYEDRGDPAPIDGVYARREDAELILADHMHRCGGHGFGSVEEYDVRTGPGYFRNDYHALDTRERDGAGNRPPIGACTYCHRPAEHPLHGPVPEDAR